MHEDGRKENNSYGMKIKNQRLVLRAIRRNPVSRAELSRILGLTRAALTNIADILIQKDIICEGEQVQSNVGRHPTLLRINPGARYAFGVAISRDFIKIALCGLDGVAIKKIVIYYDDSRYLNKANDYINEITKVINDTITENSISKEKLLGIGVSVPGPIDVEAGTILNPTNMKRWHNVSIVDKIYQKTGINTFIERDANACALAELQCGEYKNFVYLLADNGFGGGYVNNGELRSGVHGDLFEIGHMSIDIYGEKCMCGNMGCAELYVAIPNLVKKSGFGSYKLIAERAMSGNSRAIELLNYEAEKLSFVCANLCNIYNIDTFVLGGQLSHCPDMLAEKLEKKLNERIFRKGVRHINVVPALLSEDMEAEVAAGIAIEKFFTDGEI